jgi:DNA-binding transcriptional ArsR family regulator
MEDKQTTAGSLSDNKLAYNDEYFKYIFKKTEKIVCAVMYVTRNIKDISQSDRVISDLEMTAHRLIDVSVNALRAPYHVRRTYVEGTQFLFIELESKLRILHAAGLMSGEYLAVFLQEIDALQRSLKKFLPPRTEDPFSQMSLPTLGERKRRAMARRLPTSMDESGAVREKGTSRREQVLAVIRDKGEVSIKDISEVVTDCSEKTIQRELMTLINDGFILKYGERRWSRYRLSDVEHG